MQDTRSGVSYPELLLSLRDHRRAWERLEWKRTTTVKVAPDCQAYELVAGVFASSDGTNLTIVGLPSSTNDGYTMTRTPRNQITQRIHIRSISTNAPLAILIFSISPSDNFQEPVLQFGHDLLEVHYTPRILIWNWQQGSLIFDSSREILPHPISDFVFLSHDTFLITSTALHLYVFNPPSSVTLVATLHLPVTHELGGEIKVHSGPLHARPPTGTLFTPSSSERIQVFSVCYGLHLNLNLKYTMFVHTRTLLRYVERYRNGEAIPQRVVPWDLWGPHGTRFMKNDASRVWLRYAHGQRVIQQRDSTSGSKIDVIDFNYVPPSSSSALTPESPVKPLHGNSFRRTTVTRSKPTVLACGTLPGLAVFSRGRKGNPFVTKVSTSLPYHVSSVALPIPFEAFMIDDERIIGVQVRFVFGLFVV
ncbi:hypothetical protein M413DRAFT_449466 [Hebeloma cylindrosporum]|uniref:Uncharacterized protein n=1 Tax=Hebeloma cylindrosporum TaxID=76867 RepID=A0A0C3BVC9_HEBCY|nr:hypothetical protein M413DRAFT_449466 [Hebeloma cylindrosporum h7]